MLDGIVAGGWRVGGGDEPLQVHDRRPDPHRAAFVVGERDRVDIFGRPAVPVAGFLAFAGSELTGWSIRRKSATAPSSFVIATLLSRACSLCATAPRVAYRPITCWPAP